MKMRLFWLPCLMFLFGTFCASCGSDDNEPTDEPGAGGTEVKGDYTAIFNNNICLFDSAVIIIP